MLEQGLREESQGLTLSAYSARWLPAYHAEAGTKQYNQYAKIIDRALRGVRRSTDDGYHHNRYSKFLFRLNRIV